MIRRVPVFSKTTATAWSSIRFCSSSQQNSNNFESQVAAIFTANGQHSILTKKRAQLEKIQNEKYFNDKIHENHANRKPDFYAKLTLSYLIFQTGLLNYWVYNRFDWCLCEPITYLLGTAVTFIAIGYYLFTGSEYDWDVLRQNVYANQRKQIYAKHNLDVEKMDALIKEIELLEEEIEHAVPTAGSNTTSSKKE